MSTQYKKIKKEFRFGQLSELDIRRELHTVGGIQIYSAKKGELNIHRASIDITPTIVALSSRYGMLQTVYVKKSQYINSYYIYVKPRDTVLIVSNEYIHIPNYIAGYVTSRVTNVAKGFGHICTTIDPNWRGGLLIGLSNPSNRTIKIEVGTSIIIHKEGDRSIVVDNKPLATITFHYLSTRLNDNNSIYSSLRSDLLRKYRYDQKRGAKALIWKLIHFRRKRFTDYFYEYLDANEEKMKDRLGWYAFLNEFSIFNANSPGSNNNSSATNYIVCESLINKAYILMQNHRSFLITLIILILLVLLKLGIISDDLLKEILRYLEATK